MGACGASASWKDSARCSTRPPDYPEEFVSNFVALTARTASDRAQLQSVPVIARALRGEVTLQTYLAFLEQAYHHVRHTVPLLMAVGARLPARQLWLQKDLVHYLEEEQGHDEWILGDIAAAGGDAAAVRNGSPAIETDAMVAYAYDTVMRRNPVAFFGMVYVLEGTSAALALHAADAIQKTLALPGKAFTYLRSHGSLDQQHIGHLASIVDRFDAAVDLPAVVTCARTMFRLYGDVFRSLGHEASHPERLLLGAA
jgi:pyrroloquinoline quinone (PQQ) biosynthesis protein C